MAGQRVEAHLVPFPARAYLPFMGNHDHHLHAGDDLRDAAKAQLTEAGEQWTDMRQAVFDALAGFDRPASAYDIAEAVSTAQGRRVAANSVYRILDLFVQSNLAMRVESANAYVANAHPGCLHDCIFLICDTCGQTTHIDDDKISGNVRAAAEKSGFAPTRPVIEVRGKCEDCS
jgi:Fur family zinc uptake transcriptional regulator